MRSFILDSWNFVMDNRYNPLRHVDMAAQHYFMHLLAWMWSMVFSLSFLSIFHFQYVWLGHVTVIAAVFTTVYIFQRSQEQSPKKGVVPELSNGSPCIWKLDREA